MKIHLSSSGLGVCITILLVVIHTTSFAQEKKNSPFQFHGSNNTFYQYSDKSGVGSLVPEAFLRNDFNAQLVLFGIPLKGGIFYSTESDDSRQQMNHYYLELDVNAIKKRLMPDINIPKVPKIPDHTVPDVTAPDVDIPDIENPIPDSIHSPEIEKPNANMLLKFLSGFKTLEIGRTRPHYSELVLDMVSVDGFNIEYDPKIIYAAVCQGEMHREITNTFVPYDFSFPQDVIFGKIGLGDQNASHILFSVMKAKDKPDNIMHPDSINIYPAENFVTGTDARLSFWDNQIYLQAEAAVSLFTENQNSATFESFTGGFPAWVSRTFNPTTSTHVAYAYKVESGLNLKTTQISAVYSIVGPGYKTLGNPMLRNDRKTIGGMIYQSLFKNQVAFNARFDRFENDLLNWNNNKTETQILSLSTSLRLKKLPFIVLTYSPNSMENTSELGVMSMEMQMINGVLGYNYQIRKSSWQTTFIVNRQRSLQQFNSQMNETLINLYKLTHNISLKNGVQIMGEAGIMKSSYSGIEITIHNFGGGCKFQIGKSIRNSFAVLYKDNVDRDKNLALRYGLNIRIRKFASLKLSVSENMRKLFPSDPFSHRDIIVRSTLVIKW